jgi:hypothetical protein
MKPELSLLSPAPTGRASRRKPRQTGADLIKTIRNEFDLEAGGIALLNETATVLDRLNDVAAQITKDGVMQKWGRGFRPHPLLKIEITLHTLVGRNLQRLGVGLEPIGANGRPAHGFGIGPPDDDDDDED